MIAAPGSRRAETPPSAEPTTKRVVCADCLRAHSNCICHWVTPVQQPVQVLILQHPMEVHQAKGSARLLHLSLPHSRMVTGEVFDAQVLRDLLFAPWKEAEQPASAAQSNAVRQAILLYPDTPDSAALSIPAPPRLAADALHDPAQLRLVVLDGTWRKSRKMLYLNPLLQQLPRLPLQHVPASQYRIRKAHKPNQLSTLEATCAALAQLGGNAAPLLPLVSAFDGFVAQQQAHMPR